MHSLTSLVNRYFERFRDTSTIVRMITHSTAAWIASDTPLGLPDAKVSIARNRIEQPKNSAIVQRICLRCTRQPYDTAAPGQPDV